MSEALVWVNCMCRNEPVLPYALLSVAPYVDRILVYDTGSDDEYLDEIYKVDDILKYTKLQIVSRKLKDGQTWVASDIEKTIDPEVSQQLADIRREMLYESLNAQFAWTLDGDEIYPDELAKQIEKLIWENLHGKVGLSLPFVDLCHDVRHVRHDHNMFRVYRSDAVEIRNNFPFEMHYSKLTGRVLEESPEETLYLKYNNDNMAVHHYESLIKPWRKNLTVKRKFNGKLPEVFERFPQFKHRVERWL